MKTVTVNITSRWDRNKILFSAEVDTSIGERLRIKAALEIAVKDGANLHGAYLRGAYLDVANLRGANLDGANLDEAYLRGAYLDDESKLIGERPIFMLSPIGSESRTFIAYITDKGLRLRAGCFFGTREVFEAKLADTHGDNKHAIEYRAALALIDAHCELWGPVPGVEGGDDDED